MNTYQKTLKKILTSAEQAILKKLTTPALVQDFLDTLEINFEESGETLMSPRRVLQTRKAHCFEAALLGATALAYHGHTPLLLDFQTVPTDEDHVIVVFKQDGLWGALSKTNRPILRYRDPIYKSVRELALSYFNEYYDWDRTKSLRTYSRPFDLRRYAPEAWVGAGEELEYMADDIDVIPHYQIVPKRLLKKLRLVSPIEVEAMKLVEWEKKK